MKSGHILWIYILLTPLIALISVTVFTFKNPILFACCIFVVVIWLLIGVPIIVGIGLDYRTPDMKLRDMIGLSSSSEIIEWLKEGRYTADDLKIRNFKCVTSSVAVYDYIIEHDLFDKTARWTMQADLIIKDMTEMHERVFWALFHKALYSNDDIHGFIMKAIRIKQTKMVRDLIAQSTIKTSDEWLRTAIQTHAHDVIRLLLSYYDEPEKEIERLHNYDMAKGIAHINELIDRLFAPVLLLCCDTKERLLPADTQCLIERDAIGLGAKYMTCTNKYLSHPILHENITKLSNPMKCILCHERMLQTVYINK